MIAVEENGDEVLAETRTCVKCRTGFTDNGKPIYPRLVEQRGFLCCPVCGASYGAMCSDCPPPEYPTAVTRCRPCPRRITLGKSEVQK